VSADGAVLEERVAALERQLAGLRRRLEAIEGGARAPAAVAAAPAREEAPAAEAVPQARFSGSSLLARVSTVSFLLVVALRLRTVADSGMIGPGAGAAAGLVYASSLLAVGWVQYARRSQLAPVFAICGALLLDTVVVETHSHFGSLGALPAHAIIGVAVLVMTALGERFRTPVPGTIGVLGGLVSALALNVPYTSFLHLSVLMLALGAMGAFVSRRLRGDWVGWVAFALAAVVLYVWAVRLRVDMSCPDPSGLLKTLPWFPWVVWGFALLWLAQALAGLLRPPRGTPSLLSLFLPALGPAAAYVAGLQVAAARGDARAHGVVGFLLAGVLLALAAWTGRREGASRTAVPAFGFAAVVLFSLGFSSATGSLLGALPLLSLTALAFAVLAVRWESGATRLISYLLQVFVALALGLILVAGDGAGHSPALAALASLVLAATAFAHHRWCRRHAPPEGSLAFRFLGQGDRCAVALLTAALAGGFFLLRTGVSVALAGRGDVHDLFLAAQSIIINLSGIVLFALAARSRSRELRSVAILLTLIGAAKVFLYDLITVAGVARVASVFSFGLLAAFASLILGRWQRGGPE